MEKSLGFLILLLWACIGLLPRATDRNIPLFCTLESEWQRVASAKVVDTFSNPDTVLEHQLYVLSDSADQPLMFYADILTPVCIDGLCKPVYIELYWSLVGNYAGYGVFKDKPLTKFDHEEFADVDYQQLDRLLADHHSILSRRKLADLFDAGLAPEKKIEYQGVALDAVSGATRKEIRESVVEGALYSCYTLWHLVHDQVPQQIEYYLQSIYSPDLARYFLFADHEDYHYYALKRMDGPEFEQNILRIAEIFKDARPLTRTYLLKKIPKGTLLPESVARELYSVFSSVDVNSKTLLINNLPDAHAVAAELLSDQVEVMSQNQLRSYLDFLAADRSKITATIQRNLQRVAASTAYTYSYLIREFFN